MFSKRNLLFAFVSGMAIDTTLTSLVDGEPVIGGVSLVLGLVMGYKALQEEV